MAPLEAADGLALAGIVAEPGDDLVRRRDVGALHRAGDGGGDPGAEERVLAERLFVAAEPRVADRLDDEGEDLVHPDRPGLAGRGGVDPREQLHVPGAPERGAFGEDGPAGAHQSVGALLGLEQRDAQCVRSRAIFWSRLRNSPAGAGLRGGSCWAG